LTPDERKSATDRQTSIRVWFSVTPTRLGSLRREALLRYTLTTANVAPAMVKKNPGA